MLFVALPWRQRKASPETQSRFVSFYSQLFSNKSVAALLVLSGAAGWALWAWRRSAGWWDRLQKDVRLPTLPYRCFPGMILGLTIFVAGLLILRALFLGGITGGNQLYRILDYGWVVAFVGLQASVAILERPRFLIPPGARHQSPNRRRPRP